MYILENKKTRIASEFKVEQKGDAFTVEFGQHGLIVVLSEKEL